MPTLYIFSGRPGVGKTTLARALSRRASAAHLRIDTIEQALRDLCKVKVEGEGYRLAYRVAQDMLRTGLSVVADSCNPIELTRSEWRAVAEDVGAVSIDIEICCSDAIEHKTRVLSRTGDIPGASLPAWDDIMGREYHFWTSERLVLDTLGQSVAESAAKLFSQLDV